MDWISVEERLPELGKLVIIFSNENDTYCASLFGISDKGRYFDNWQINCCCSGCESGYVFEVTHWMPLPEPPNE